MNCLGKNSTNASDIQIQLGAEYLVDLSRNFAEILFFFAAGGFRRGTEPESRRVHRRACVIGNGVFVHDNSCRLQFVRRSPAAHAFAVKPCIHPQQVSFRSPFHNTPPELFKFIRKRFCIFPHLCRVLSEGGSIILTECHGYCRNRVKVRTALQAGNDDLVYLFVKFTRIFAREDHSRAGTAKRFVSCCSNDVSVKERGGICFSCDKSRKVRHVYHEKSAAGIRYLAKLFEINYVRISGESRDNDVRLFRNGDPFYLVIIKPFGFLAHSVWNLFPEFSRHGNGLAVCEMASVGKRHTHYLSSGRNECRVNGKVCRRTRKRLYVHAPTVRVKFKKLQRALLREQFHFVDYFGSAVV